MTRTEALERVVEAARNLETAVACKDRLLDRPQQALREALLALAAVIPAIRNEALERAAVWHDEQAAGEGHLAQAAKAAGDKDAAMFHAHLAAEHRSAAAAIRAMKELGS